MIQPVRWPHLFGAEFRSPFLRGDKERPLRLTLHVQSLEGLRGEDKAAYDAVRELGQLVEIDVLAAAEDTFPYFRLMPPSSDGYRHIEVLENGEHRSLHCGIHPSRLDDEQASARGHGQNEASLSAIDDFIAVEAHAAMHRDIFVTGSPLLLEHPKRLSHANIRSAGEAAKLVGLFLRSRDNWTYRRSHIATCRTSRSTFYWVLARTSLLALWRYFSACVHAKEHHGDKILDLGGSILSRCSRALQARDSIGEQCHMPQDHGTTELIMYHFDYLTLLLAGIFDAQAEVAKITYGIACHDLNVKFRGRSFLDRLQRSNADQLYKLVTSDRCKLLMTMLHTLRNTIHGAGLTTQPRRVVDQELSLVELPEGKKEEVWQAALALGGTEEWGLSRREYSLADPQTGQTARVVEVCLEPYSYATLLVREWFDLIDHVAAATEVERLFTGKNMPPLMEKTPEEWDKYVQRFEILGK